MSETKHTPGPWEFDGPPHNIIVWSSPNNRVCFLTSDGPTEANGRLIAAAPDLLAAAKRFFILEVETCNCDACTGWAKDLKAAISKAEGSLT